MKTLLFLSFLAALLLGCSGCDDSDGEKPDASTDTDVDSDAYADTDADTDSDADSDSDGDTDTGTDSYCGTIADAGPWVWTDIPDAGDCDSGVQLTHTSRVQTMHWDVEDGRMVFIDENHSPKYFDMEHGRMLSVTNPRTGAPVDISNSTGSVSAILLDGKLLYALSGTNSDYFQYDLVLVDPVLETSFIIHNNKESTEAEIPDAYYSLAGWGDNVVSAGGCDSSLVSELCSFKVSNPCTTSSLNQEITAGSNFIQDDVLVFIEPPSDIRGYRFSTGQFFDITDDTAKQLFPRFHGDYVVYQDLRFGSSSVLGNWNHCAVFAYQLSTGTTIQVTDGQWIAANPDVHDGIVVWSDYRNCSNPNNKDDIANIEIWGKNLQTGVVHQITNLPGRPKHSARIWDDKVYVHMYKTTLGENAIYVFDLPSQLQ